MLPTGAVATNTAQMFATAEWMVWRIRADRCTIFLRARRRGLRTEETPVSALGPHKRPRAVGGATPAPCRAERACAQQRRSVGLHIQWRLGAQGRHA